MTMKNIFQSIALLVLLAGCTGQTNTERALKMDRTSGKMTRGSDSGYRAVCETITPDAHTNTWQGTLWPEREKAMREVIDHNRQYTNHHAEIRH